MKEINNLPTCPVCGQMKSKDEKCYHLWGKFWNEYPELEKGCPVCGQSLIVPENKKYVCCSSPECPRWEVHKNGTALYGRTVIFSVSWKEKTIDAFTGMEAPHMELYGFYKKLFHSIIKEKFKGSNIFKGLRMRIN